MPLLVKIYITVYILLMASNMGFWLYLKGKLWVVLLDLASSLILITSMIAYYHKPLKDMLGLWHAILVTVVIGIEFYISVWKNPKDLGIEIPVPDDIEESSMEFSKALGLIFNAPAYIISGLLAWDIYSSYFCKITGLR